MNVSQTVLVKDLVSTVLNMALESKNCFISQFLGKTLSKYLSSLS